jgi:hypothetical protein
MNKAGWSKPQWCCYITVFHGPEFGHRISFMTQTQGREPERIDSLDWTGLGMPSDMIKTCQAIASSIVSDHLVWRYGVQDSLDFGPGGEVAPF